MHGERVKVGKNHLTSDRALMIFQSSLAMPGGVTAILEERKLTFKIEGNFHTEVFSGGGKND